VQIRVVVIILLLTVAGVAEESAPEPVDCRQLLSWMAAGIPNQRLSRLVQERGLAFSVNQETSSLLAKAGATSDFLQQSRTLSKGNAAGPNGSCPAELAQAAAFVHEQNYARAETILRKFSAANPDDPYLHLALGYVRQQQGDLDEAFDGYADAKDLNPEFPEIHNGLAVVFYRSNDGDNAIAEARTALSIDPNNAEGYRYLGLGLYANENYKAAVHAFRESLARDPSRAETYYDMGLAQAAEKNLAAAADSYKKALNLDPELLEARTSLGAVLTQLGHSQAAVSDGHKLQPESASPR
jgi:tetratricopeptide (TPR) repeat protein